MARDGVTLTTPTPPRQQFRAILDAGAEHTKLLAAQSLRNGGFSALGSRVARLPYKTHTVGKAAGRTSSRCSSARPEPPLNRAARATSERTLLALEVQPWL